jgi:hypothetical protein
MTIKQFCEKHGACQEGYDWAIQTGCKTMSELWQRDDIKPKWRMWIATCPGVMFDKDLRLFACWCVRQAWHLLTDERSRNAVEVAERFAVGAATEEELAAARYAAGDAAGYAGRAAAWAAARAAFWAAAGARVRVAARAVVAKKLMEYAVCFEEREK